MKFGRNVDWKSYFEKMVRKFPGAKLIREVSPWVHLSCKRTAQGDLDAELIVLSRCIESSRTDWIEFSAELKLQRANWSRLRSFRGS